MASRASARSASDFVVSSDSRAGSVPRAHGPSQYPGHTGRVSTPGTRAESVPLAHGPSQYPGHTGRVSTPGTQAESVPLAHGPDQSPGSRAESVPNRQQSKHALSSAHGPAVTLFIWNPCAATNAALVPSPGPGAFTSAKASPALAGPWPPRPPWLVPSPGPGADRVGSSRQPGPEQYQPQWLVPLLLARGRLGSTGSSRHPGPEPRNRLPVRDQL